MKSKTGERAALVLLIAYCLDLAWKLAHWSELNEGIGLVDDRHGINYSLRCDGRSPISVHTDEKRT
jgi:hypothetical protein